MIVVALIYIAINFSIIGVVPWREFVPASERPSSDFVVSIFMERIYGAGVATLFTAMVLWTAFGSVFALLLGYSRPLRGSRMAFFKIFTRLHRTRMFLTLRSSSLSRSLQFFSLGMVIDALITTRILVQFVSQILAVSLLRRNEPEMSRPYRIWLYPLPNLVALVGWIFVFATTDWPIILFGMGTLGLGLVCFIIWSWHTRQWPFARESQGGSR